LEWLFVLDYNTADATPKSDHLYFDYTMLRNVPKENYQFTIHKTEDIGLNAVIFKS
tara:strand:+ start:297 stop:464 length:168 start_codon:yes stop_codon:yes gene_type:complete